MPRVGDYFFLHNYRLGFALVTAVFLDVERYCLGAQETIISCALVLVVLGC